MNDDLTARARLRDAAIALVSEGQRPTARTVAARAGVSAGLIRHHFGTMEGLLLASDERIAQLVRDAKHDAIHGPMPNVFQAIQATGDDRIFGYLAHRLTESSPAIDTLVDLLSEDAVTYIQRSIDAGLLLPVPDIHGAARMMTLYSLGSLVLHRHLHRLLDLDLTAQDLESQPGIARYVQLQLTLFGGLFGPELAKQLRTQLKADS